MPIGIPEFQGALTRLAGAVGRRTDRLLNRISHLSVREARAFITDAYPILLEPFIIGAGELTAAWYKEQPGGVPSFNPDAAPPRPRGQYEVSGRWALDQKSPHDAMRSSAERAVFNASRDTVLDNVYRENARWVRYASATACGFCRLLATQDPGYRTEESALTVVGRSSKRGYTGKTRGSQSLGERYHDNCRCIAVMVRKGDLWVPPDYVEQWKEDYVKAATKHPYDTKAIIKEMDAERMAKYNESRRKTPSPTPA